jgi:GNAT superfamily N-acetyltransferase
LLIHFNFTKMNTIKFRLITPDDKDAIACIAEWYFTEWDIPIHTITKKINAFKPNDFQFQVLMTLDNIPVATGGLYNHVGLLDKEPKFKVYKNWLALVYTILEYRGKGFGALLCNYIQQHAKEMGLKEIFLFTHTAESLYKRLGWQQVERLVADSKDIVVMKKEL